jgi:hypothetical protein
MKRHKFKVGDIVKSDNDFVSSYKVLKVNYKTLEVIINDGAVDNVIYVCKKSLFEMSNDKDITDNINNLKYYDPKR